MMKKSMRIGSGIMALTLVCMAMGSQINFGQNIYGQNIYGQNNYEMGKRPGGPHGPRSHPPQIENSNKEETLGTRQAPVIEVNEVMVSHVTSTVVSALDDLSYPVVDTNQSLAFCVEGQSLDPLPGQSVYGQDANYVGYQADYTSSEDGTVTDNVTGLTWTSSPGKKVSYQKALDISESLTIGGYTDWRLPTIKELYSLIDFSGVDPDVNSTSDASLEPFINTDYFDFTYGDIDAGERIIDSQFVSSTLYTSTTMFGNETVFGVNFADGRIKGYPLYDMKNNDEKKFYALYVRGNTSYGQNNYIDNEDGTITDLSTGLMWMKADSGQGMDWENALAYGEESTYAGYDDWRLPDAKELQSIVDYSKSPQGTNSAAINSVFDISEIEDELGRQNYPFYWSSTTHISSQRGGIAAVYIAFGEALGYMEDRRSGQMKLLDVHGAGAQRSDSKSGDASMYPSGRGPQGDVVRIENYVRLVRSVDINE